MKGPIKTIPLELRGAYTMDGRIKVVEHYIDSDWEYTPRVFTAEQIDENIKNLNDGSFTHYNGQEVHLVPTILNYVKDKNVLVIGSISPAIESICLFGGAVSVSTLEYNKIECEDSRIKTYTYADTLNSKFDVIISYSSFEHSGLGRYGDELDPDADLLAMNHAESLLTDDGLLILAVPIGEEDILEWNAHRVYGPIQLPLLLNGWTVKEVNPSINNFKCDILQPIFVLKKDYK